MMEAFIKMERQSELASAVLTLAPVWALFLLGILIGQVCRCCICGGAARVPGCFDPFSFFRKPHLRPRPASSQLLPKTRFAKLPIGSLLSRWYQLTLAYHGFLLCRCAILCGWCTSAAFCSVAWRGEKLALRNMPSPHSLLTKSLYAPTYTGRYGTRWPTRARCGACCARACSGRVDGDGPSNGLRALRRSACCAPSAAPTASWTRACAMTRSGASSALLLGGLRTALAGGRCWLHSWTAAWVRYPQPLAQHPSSRTNITQPHSNQPNQPTHPQVCE